MNSNERARIREIDAQRRVMGGSGGDMGSRTRPGKQPVDTVQLLRDLRKSTRQYLLICEAALAALPKPMETDETPELTLLRSMLRVATGAKGTTYGFGTPAALDQMLSQALGEE